MGSLLWCPVGTSCTALWVREGELSMKPQYGVFWCETVSFETPLCVLNLHRQPAADLSGGGSAHSGIPAAFRRNQIWPFHRQCNTDAVHWGLGGGPIKRSSATHFWVTTHQLRNSGLESVSVSHAAEPFFPSQVVQADQRQLPGARLLLHPV